MSLKLLWPFKCIKIIESRELWKKNTLLALHIKIFFISYQHNLLQNTLDKCTIITINCLLNQCTNTYVWYICYLLAEASKKYGNLFFSSFIIFHCRATYLKCAVLWCFVQLHLSRNYFYLYQKERFWNYILNFPSIQWGVGRLQLLSNFL